MDIKDRKAFIASRAFARIRRSRLAGLLLALILTLVAVALRLLIAPIDAGVQYVTLFPTVAIAAVIGGAWAGMFAAGIGMALASYFFWSPYEALVFEFQYQMLLSNAVFMIDAVLVCTAIGAMHRYYQRAEDVGPELQRAASVFEHTAEGVMITDGKGIIQTVNPAFTTITGYTAQEAIGQRPSLLRSDHQGQAFYLAMWAALGKTGFWQGELWNRRKNGEAYLEWLTINRVLDGKGRAVSYVGVFHDITELRLKDERIRHLAYHDALTGLPNRVLMQDRLEHALERAKREGRKLAVAFIDLDRFKQINDSLGHAVGDLLLQEVARRIRGRLRSMDTIARLGGDEFLLLMEELSEVADCVTLLESLIDEISRPMHLQGHAVQVGASVGVASFPEDGADAAQLMASADKAMYAAKSAGRNQCRLSKGESPVWRESTGLSREPAEGGERRTV